MKVKPAIFIILILVVCCCENESDFVYSCDPFIDAYVRNNFQELPSLKINEIIALSDELQRAIYRSYTAEKKYEIWTERLNLILDTEYWTREETLHIISLIDYICPEVFTGDDTKVIEKGIDLEFPDHWIEYGYNYLLWDVNKMEFVISSLQISYYDFVNNMQGISNMKKTAKAGGETCNCNQSNSLCYPGTCIDTSCDRTDGGCGWLWLEECNGKCLIEY